MATRSLDHPREHDRSFGAPTAHRVRTGAPRPGPKSIIRHIPASILPILDDIVCVLLTHGALGRLGDVRQPCSPAGAGDQGPEGRLVDQEPVGSAARTSGRYRPVAATTRRYDAGDATTQPIDRLVLQREQRQRAGSRAPTQPCPSAGRLGRLGAEGVHIRVWRPRRARVPSSSGSERSSLRSGYVDSASTRTAASTPSQVTASTGSGGSRASRRHSDGGLFRRRHRRPRIPPLPPRGHAAAPQQVHEAAGRLHIRHKYRTIKKAMLTFARKHGFRVEYAHSGVKRTIRLLEDRRPIERRRSRSHSRETPPHQRRRIRTPSRSPQRARSPSPLARRGRRMTPLRSLIPSRTSQAEPSRLQHSEVARAPARPHSREAHSAPSARTTARPQTSQRILNRVSLLARQAPPAGAPTNQVGQCARGTAPVGQFRRAPTGPGPRPTRSQPQPPQRMRTPPRASVQAPTPTHPWRVGRAQFPPPPPPPAPQAPRAQPMAHHPRPQSADCVRRFKIHRLVDVVLDLDTRS